MDRRRVAIGFAAMLMGVLVGCSTTAPATDRGASPAAELDSLDYRFQTKDAYGGGAIRWGYFKLDRECMIDSYGALDSTSLRDEQRYSGPLSKAECAKFQALVTSDAMMRALRTPPSSGACSADSSAEDYPHLIVTLVGATPIGSESRKCTSDEPFRTLIPTMLELRKGIGD
jgi:hypothetical protein